MKFDLKTTTLDGEGQAAKGTFKVFALKQPEKVPAADILGTPYWFPRRQGGRDAEARPGEAD